MSHSETSAPAATAVAATVNAWAHRSGSSAPAVDFTTNRTAGPPMAGWLACCASLC